MSENINLWHGDLWSVSFSNIPTITDITDLNIFESNVKSCSLPEYGLTTDGYEFLGYRLNTPLAHKMNTDLSPLQLEFKLSEDFRNYTYLFKWIQNLRYGSDVTNLDKTDGDPVARRFVTKELKVNILDNLKRPVLNFGFMNCFCVSISSLPLTFGTGEELTFVTNWVYEQILVNEEDIPTCDR